MTAKNQSRFGQHIFHLALLEKTQQDLSGALKTVITLIQKMCHFRHFICNKLYLFIICINHVFGIIYEGIFTT